jgi:TonB family protein
MLATRRLRLAPEWDGRFTRMVALSGLAHATVVVLALVLTARSGPMPLPITAYTVELTDPNALGGRLPPGKISTKPTAEASAPAPAPGEPAAQPSAPQPPAPEPEPAATVEPPKPEPVAKVEPPKPEPPKPDAVKIEPEKKPEPPKPPPKPAAKPAPKPTPPKPVAEKPKPAPEKPAEKPKAAAEKPAADRPATEKPAAEKKPTQAAKPGGQGGPADADAAPKDAYTAAAERWRTKAQGQGLGGTDGGSGPIGAGGEGPGGGGQLVGVEFLAYRQTVITTVKGHWTNVVATPGLMAAVRFQIGVDGSLGGIRLERSSGNSAYDSSVLRAVQRTEQLPPPPAKYAKEFGEFVIEFHSEESGGKGSG